MTTWISRAGQAAGVLAAAALAGAWAADARRRERERRALHRVLVELLMNALTADDLVTARHSRRVADLSFALASACGVPHRERATLRVAALLHDLGKIDDRFFAIVNARRALTDEERRRMHEHPDVSAYILGPLETVHPGISQIVSSHHERWDGAGYPCGRAGEEIPLGARIIAIADVFDAMAQARSYKAARPVEDVLRELRKEGGKQFDPALVKLLDRPSVRRRFAAIAARGRRDEAEIAQHDTVDDELPVARREDFGDARTAHRAGRRR